VSTVHGLQLVYEKNKATDTSTQLLLRMPDFYETHDYLESCFNCLHLKCTCIIVYSVNVLIIKVIRSSQRG